LNLLDLLIVVAAVSAAVGGYRLGLMARAASWIGLAIGLAISARVLPSLIAQFQDSDASSRLLVAAGVLMGGAFIGQGIGLLVGSHVIRYIPHGPLRQFDRGAGAFVGLLGVPLANMNVRNIGIIGYVLLFPCATVMLAVLFSRRRASSAA
jgi:hypothetical protein